jgi:hypothetical protein
MKKHLLLLTWGISAFSAIAQMSIPNGNFESWTSAAYDYPEFYPENSNPQNFFHYMAPFNVTKSTDAYSGSFALRLETNTNGTDTCFAYIANPSNSNGDPLTWTGGMPISEKPLGIRGYYKYNVPSADSAIMLVVARAGGVNIGTYQYTLGGVHSTYTLFNFTFTPALAVTPDSIIFAAASSNALAGSGIPGSVFLLDSVSFTGITTQPAQMNGDFELWQSNTIESPDMWYAGGGGSQGNGLSKTTDKVAGNYAIQLETLLGDNNGVPRANAAYASTGYWDQSCSCQKGGYPFTNMIDTLVFSYKYVPADPTDSASVNMYFKNSGTGMGWAGTSLFPSASYQVKEIPFNLFGMPDSVIINMQSSAWGDSTLNFVGAILKIDEMHFKSQPLSTGINALSFNNDVRFYPNPFKSSGTIAIGSEINTTGMLVTIYDITGRTIKTLSTDEHKITIDRSNMENGIYFYELKINNNIIKTGKFVVE